MTVGFFDWAVIVLLLLVVGVFFEFVLNLVLSNEEERDKESNK
jgi:hypothetical protein